MSYGRIVGLVSVAAMMGGSLWVLSCSSSSDGTAPGDDGGGDGTMPHVFDGGPDGSGRMDVGNPPPPDGGNPDSPATGCTPSDPGTWMPMWTPPAGPYANACNLYQLSTFAQDCFGSAATTTTCSSWQKDPANAGCGPCAFGRDSTTGPLPVLLFEVSTAGGAAAFYNTPGCILDSDPMDPMAIACAKAFQAEFQCAVQSCQANCPIPKMDDGGAQAAFGACITASQDAGCASYATAASLACSWAADSGPGVATQICNDGLSNTATIDQLFAVFNLFCGSPGELDGGLLTDTGTDTGSGDAAGQ